MAWSSLPSATSPSVMVPPVSMSTVYMDPPRFPGRPGASRSDPRPAMCGANKSEGRGIVPPAQPRPGRPRSRLLPAEADWPGGPMAVDIDESQRKISALVRVGRAMVSAADYELALSTLIETVSRLLDVETGGFLVYDPAHDELVL